MVSKNISKDENKIKQKTDVPNNKNLQNDKGGINHLNQSNQLNPLNQLNQLVQLVRLEACGLFR